MFSFDLLNLVVFRFGCLLWVRRLCDVVCYLCACVLMIVLLLSVALMICLLLFCWCLCLLFACVRLCLWFACVGCLVFALWFVYCLIASD